MSAIETQIQIEPSVSQSLSIRKFLQKFFIYVVLLFGIIAVIFPFLWMISTSLKDLKDVFAYPIQWIPTHPRWSNYEIVIKGNFLLFYWNSFKVTGLITIFQLITSTMAAYAFSKLRFPGRDFIFLIYISTMMIPLQAILIPQFMLMKTLGLVNNHWSVILIYAFSPVGVFMIRQFFITIPSEIIEAARIDGCGEVRIFSSIILPMAKPALAALTILTFSWAWNDMLLPLIYFFDKKLFTIPLGLLTFNSEHGQNYQMTMAGTVMALLPVIIIYFAGQKHFIEGVASSAVKG